MSRQSKDLSRAETLRRKDERRRKTLAVNLDIERIDVRRLLANPTPNRKAV